MAKFNRTDQNTIVYEFLNTNDSLIQIVERNYSKNQLLEETFLKLNELFLKEFNHDLLISIDNAIKEGHKDSNLYILFISQSIIYLSSNGIISNSKSLYSLASSILSKNVHPMIKAYLIYSNSRIKLAEGNLKENFSLLNESIKFVDKSLPRYSFFSNTLLTSLALQGQLKEKGKYKIELENSNLSPSQYYRILEIKTINNILTCNNNEGKKLFEERKKNKLFIQSTKMDAIEQILEIIKGNFNPSMYIEDQFKNLAQIYQSLSAARFEESQKNLSLLNDNLWSQIFIKNFTCYLPIHIELCQSKKGKARLLLQEKLSKGTTFYLDDLFWGRLQLLENDFEAAEKSFKQLIENVNRFDAEPRLIFELQFAKELNLSLILQLLNHFNGLNLPIFFKVKPEKVLEKSSEKKGIDLLIGESNAILNVKNLVKKYSEIKAPILITGETGTGKELVSKAIHDEGQNPNEPFLAINCGALSDTLLQSELFGYEAGAFTGALKQKMGIFEAAGKGTVFLDEFGDISPKLQVSLLRVLESNEIRSLGSIKTKKIECKIVIATNVNLQEAVHKKKFREDLFFRLSRFEIKLPSLRERLEDIPLLIKNFLPTKSITSNLRNALITYHWPGNIRELKNEIEKLSILNPDSEIFDLEHFDFTHLQDPLFAFSGSTNQSINNETKNSISNSFEERELNAIQKGFPIEQRILKIKKLFLKHKKLTRSQIMEIMDIGSTTASKDIDSLIKMRFIIRRTPTQSKSTNYFELVE